ncbi:MAG: hypothetical protein NUV63_06150 [Gallionella sp.]|nr:hypothetical protein [Gallionella sp.]
MKPFRFVTIVAPIIGALSFTHAASGADFEISSNDANIFTHGYGITNFYIVPLPLPFVEAGVSLGAVSVRGNLMFAFAAAGISAEVELNNAINNNISVFFSRGATGVIGAGYKTYGIGLDVPAKEKNIYYRIEFVHYDGRIESRTTDIFNFPRIAYIIRY